VSESDLPVDIHIDDLSFKEAFRRVWVANPTGTVRNCWAVFGCLFMLGIQVAMLVVVDNAWALLGVVCLPVAGWFILRGWVYQRLAWRVLGLLLFVLGAMVPFYLV
jgi:hypothetical protein